MKKLWFYKTKIGTIGIAEDGRGITDVFLGEKSEDLDVSLEETPLLRRAAAEIEEYLDGRRKEFEAPIHLAGTDFQKKVWETLRRIPYGQTRSYQEIAESVGNPKACRAVGMANHKNPIMILVPCHRVVGKNGSLTGYAGGLEIKKFLLELENPARKPAGARAAQIHEEDIRADQVSVAGRCSNKIRGDAIVENVFSAGAVRCALEDLAEPEFQKFASSLIPNIPAETVLGVRLPKLRKMAAQIAKGDWRAYLAQASGDSYEEVMLQGMVIGKIQAPLSETLERIRDFLPKIDNWSVCDSFCAGLKLSKTCPEEIWAFLQPYFQAKEEYSVRFAAVMLLNYYVDEAHREEALKLLAGVRHDSYYVKMAVAWAISIYYIRFPEFTRAFLKNAALDDSTYQKTLQKILESRAVKDEEKELIRRMKKRD